METIDKKGKLLFTVEEVFATEGYLGAKKKEYFNIPHYQRGYKWEPNNLEKLLDDIFNFEIGEGKFYCLQNITIVAHGACFNVIDGQQRLTTLTIILSLLDEKELVANKVRFPENSIRKMTNQFLNTVVTRSGEKFPDLEWSAFAEKHQEYDLQDVAHIYNVYKAADGWFKKKLETGIIDLTIFKTKLLQNVRLIVNEVDGRTSEEKVFGNLNSKRVPLDGSDLIRAILITRVAREEGRKENDLKNIVYVNERRVKLGWELDQINNWWGRKDIKGYFSRFVSIKSELVGGSKKLFNEDLYPINCLYLLYAEVEGKDKLTLDLIEQYSSSTIVLYKDILKLHSTLQDWYEDKEIYHFLGFIMNAKGKKIKFCDIWEIWINAETRKNFIGMLKDLMRISFLADDNSLLNFKDGTLNWYKDLPDKLLNTLVLMDVMHSIKANQPNLPFDFFTKGLNDIEHIFPQNPEDIVNKKEFMVFLNKIESDKKAHFDLSNFEKLKDNEKFQDRMNHFINNKISKIPINAIGNLVLLYSNLNKSISNSIYSSKRSRIIEYHSLGYFIQPHTFKVFTRNFNDEQQTNRDFEYWTKDDIVRNCEYIEREINNFFTLPN